MRNLKNKDFAIYFNNERWKRKHFTKYWLYLKGSGKSVLNVEYFIDSK